MAEVSLEENSFSPVIFYSLINLELELSGHLDHVYRLGGGGTIGTLIDVTDDWRIQIAGDYLSFPLGHQSHYYKVSVNQRYSFTQNTDIRIEWNIQNSQNEWLLAVNYYF